MAKFVFVGTHGSEDPNRASFPVVQAAAAIDGGHTAAIVLMGDAVLIMKDAIAENIHGIGIPPLKEALRSVIAADVPIWL